MLRAHARPREEKPERPREERPSINDVMPIRFLYENLGKTIAVRLKSGVVIFGRLHRFDRNLNLVLLDAVSDENEKLGTCVIRGDNVLFFTFVEKI
jgi:small nuclear ribonucleoprotein (snRNP)-like protein